jgi:hypothetical protein
VRCLFVSCRADDYVASCLWDGFQELCGEENVIDAVGVPGFHKGCGLNPCSRISASRIGKTWDDGKAIAVDLVVVNACILREFSWDWFSDLLRRVSFDKLVLVEGWDSSHQVENPPFPVDAVFRREIDPYFEYPYKCHSLTMAAPSRWFVQTDDRPFDVFYASQSNSSESRWEVLSAMFQTKNKHRSIGASRGVGFDNYFLYLQTHKLAICPPGAANALDCLRTWEAVANGCIPIFLEIPMNHKIDPWFAEDECFSAQHATMLPYWIDKALGMDLKPIRDKMQATAREKHTTKSRAAQILKAVGM